jgi:hypothetical protein
VPVVDAYQAVETYEEPSVEPAEQLAPYMEAYEYAGADAVSEVGAVDGDAPAEISEEPTSDGREAMRALLAELSPKFEEPVAAPVSAPVGDPVDGLMDRGPWTSHELEQMGGWQRDDGQDVIAWPDDEKASDPVAASVQDAGAAFHPGSGYDSDSDTVERTSAEGYQLADFGFPLRAEEPVTNGHSDPPSDAASAHAADDEQGEHEPEMEEEPQEEPAEEPMNRGLLLKFLSSVRN